MSRLKDVLGAGVRGYPWTPFLSSFECGRTEHIPLLRFSLLPLFLIGSGGRLCIVTAVSAQALALTPQSAQNVSLFPQVVESLPNIFLYIHF